LQCAKNYIASIFFIKLEQRDYLQKQIDQLGRVLGKIFSDLLGLKSQGLVDEGISFAEQALKNEIDLDLAELSTILPEDLIYTLTITKHFSNENLNLLAEIFYIIADQKQMNSKDDSKSIELYNKCLIIFEHLNNSETTYSFDRNAKMERIRQMFLNSNQN